MRLLSFLLLSGCGVLGSIRAEVRTQNYHLVCKDETRSECTAYSGWRAEPVRTYDRPQCCDGHGGAKYANGSWVYR